MPAGADRHVHVELGDPVAIVAPRRDRRARPGVARRAHLPARGASEMPGFDGPLIRAAGPMLTAPGGYPTRPPGRPRGPASRWPTAERPPRAVADLAARGAVAIKVSLNAEAGPTPSDAVLAAICDAAAEHDLPVTAHAQGRRAGRARARGRHRRARAHAVDRAARRRDDRRRGGRHADGLDPRHPRRSVATRRSCGCALDNLARFLAPAARSSTAPTSATARSRRACTSTSCGWLRAAGLATEGVLQAFVRAPIEVGAPADLLVVGESPLGDVAALDDIRSSFAPARS